MNEFIENMVGWSIVYADRKLFIMWNKSKTFNVFDYSLNSIDSFTSDCTGDLIEAGKAAIRYTDDMYAEAQ